MSQRTNYLNYYLKSRFSYSKMSAPNSGELNTSMTRDEIPSVGSHKVEDVGNAAASSSVPIMSEKVARQVKEATDSLTKQLEKLCDLLKGLQRNTSRRSGETSGLIQDPSRPRGDRFDNNIIHCSKIRKQIRPMKNLFTLNCNSDLKIEYLNWNMASHEKLSMIMEKLQCSMDLIKAAMIYQHDGKPTMASIDGKKQEALFNKKNECQLKSLAKIVR